MPVFKFCLYFTGPSWDVNAQRDPEGPIPTHPKIVPVRLGVRDLHRLEPLFHAREADFGDASANVSAGDARPRRRIEERNCDVKLTLSCGLVCMHRAFCMSDGVASNHFRRQHPQGIFEYH